MYKRRKIAQNSEVRFSDSSDEDSVDELTQAQKIIRGREAKKKARKKQKKSQKAAKRKEETGPHPNDLPRRIKYRNKQRVLVFSTRGINHRDRHLMNDLRDLLPHSKKDAKLDTKSQLGVAVNEVCDMKNCNGTIFFEARKRRDLYIWIAKAPDGPSIKFQVQNIHTMAELKLTGNCLKGSRPVLSFDANFDNSPQYQLAKELLSQIFGSPRGHPKTKPFVDHVFSFFILDNRIWFRNYQIVYHSDKNQNIKTDPVLVEIGPRFVLNPIKIFEGSFQGATLWENTHFISPNTLRSNAKKRKSDRYVSRQESKAKRDVAIEESVLPTTILDELFKEGVKESESSGSDEEIDNVDE